MKTFVVDSFTDRPFCGNPAGVCFPLVTLTDSTMLKVADELGYSETAFVTPVPREDEFSIRFFSPRMEVPLCGHATLGAARVLLDGSRKRVTFVNIDGLELPARQVDDGIEMRFPVYVTVSADAPPALLSALKLTEVRNSEYNEETRILLLEIEDPKVLAAIEPDFEALVKSHDGINGVLVTAPSDGDGFDFHSRYFWPWSGTNEDPVTGGTHTFLTGYWAQRLGKNKMRSFQSSRRTGFMEVELTEGGLLITGSAAIVLQGEMFVSD